MKISLQSIQPSLEFILQCFVQLQYLDIRCLENSLRTENFVSISVVGKKLILNLIWHQNRSLLKDKCLIDSGASGTSLRLLKGRVGMKSC